MTTTQTLADFRGADVIDSRDIIARLPDLWGVDGPTCDRCYPVDVSVPFGHTACELCPHVRCAICGAWAEAGDPEDLAEAMMALWRARPLPGQTSWLDA